MKMTNDTRMKSDFARIAQCLGLVFSLIGVLMMTPGSAQADAAAIRAGFNTSTLPANDDGSTGLVPLGFNINFFGQGFTHGYVNNNGNMTFDGALRSYTPFGLTATDRKIIAPFFADVDTAVAGSNPVTYGQGTVGSRPAFGVNWINVACYATPNGGYNTFQMVLIDRSDIGAGDFDIEFNYGSIAWETGQASGGNSVCEGGSSVRVGYSNGSTSSFELAGSGVPGAFLDSNLVTGLIYNNRNSLQSGRYVFEVRNGNAPIGHSISGTIFGNDNSHPLADSLVQVCTTVVSGTFCSLTSSNANGQYNIGGLSDGPYEVKAFAPAGTNFQAASINATLAGVDLSNQDIILVGPQPLPTGTSISPTNNNVATGAQPVVYWNNPLTLTTQGCTGGTASYVVTSDADGSIFASGNMSESASNPGTYSAVIPAFYPQHGWVTVSMTITCPGGGTTTVEFSMYIDPSGVVKDTNGVPVSGATVTLYRSDSSAGPFAVVPNGSAIMDVNNRNNPSLTNAQGLFGWDVVEGYYKVRAEKQGCAAPNSAETFVETGVMQIPPPVTDIQLVLDCGTQVFAVCDVNQDGFVSKADISIISRSLRQTVPAGTSGDINGDGRITTQDTRGCALQCTLPSCAEPTPN